MEWITSYTGPFVSPGKAREQQRKDISIVSICGLSDESDLLFNFFNVFKLKPKYIITFYISLVISACLPTQIFIINVLHIFW